MKLYQIDGYTREALNRLVDYMFDDEARNYEESAESNEHIFRDVSLVASWLDKTTDDQ